MEGLIIDGGMIDRMNDYVREHNDYRQGYNQATEEYEQALKSANEIPFWFFKGFLIVCGAIIFCYLSGYLVLFLWSL